MAYTLVFSRHPPLMIDKNICYGQTEVPLRRGWKATLAPFMEVLRKENIHTIYTSPLQRCYRPARYCAEGVGGRVIVDDRLKELNFGVWEGKSWDDIGRDKLDLWAKNIDYFQFPRGESVADLAGRVKQFWDEITTSDEDFAVITHGGVLKFLCAWAEDKTPNMMAPSQDLGTYKIFQIKGNKK